MWELVRSNQRRAAFLVVAMAALLLVAGYAFGEVFSAGGGLGGLLAALALWLVLSLISYLQGDRILLAVSGARRVSREDHPALHNVVEEMTIASGLARMPDIYVMDQAAPNAFATGRDERNAAVAVTAGLLESLDRDELQGVIAHELAHVRNRDVLYMMMVGVMLGAIVILADAGSRLLFYGGGRRRTSSREGGQAAAVIAVVAILLLILSPLIAQLISLAVSRRREYLADACSALYTRYPEGLARALEKISASASALPTASRATAPMYIVNPLGATARGLADLTGTHPPISERIRILRAIAGTGLRGYDEAFRKVTGRAVGVIPASALRAPQGGGGAPRTAEVQAGTRLERVRQTTDMLWRLNGYVPIACACGTALKVPPAYLGRRLECPHCGAPHDVRPVAA